MYYQMYAYFDHTLSISSCGFWLVYNLQTSLLAMIKNWRKGIDNGRAKGAVKTDLSKAFDCINHTMLIAKLAAFGLDYDSLRFVHSYLTEIKQKN